MVRAHKHYQSMPPGSPGSPGEMAGGATAGSGSLLLLKLRVDEISQCGADLSFLSVFPHEKEIVFPPCTYLEPRGDHEEKIRVPGGGEVSLKVIEVTPHVVGE